LWLKMTTADELHKRRDETKNTTDNNEQQNQMNVVKLAAETNITVFYGV